MSRRRKQIFKLKENILQYPGYTKKDISLFKYVTPRFNKDPLNPDHSMESHLPYANYCGPGTDIRRRLREKVKPTTAVDLQCVRHDIDYWNLRQLIKNKQISKEQAKKMTRASDDRLIAVSKFNMRHPSNPVDALHAGLAYAGIKAKELAEDHGIISHNKFVGGDFDIYEFLNGIINAKKPDPAKNLRKHLKIQKSCGKKRKIKK